ncbi:hypothetical protein [Citricoccus nitrophenolicus]|uniref:hypothetical protein n=1 Tax=Citricoccus nitrophenolicus TaxID=863575 RepID=UPI0031E54F8E
MKKILDHHITPISIVGLGIILMILILLFPYLATSTVNVRVDNGVVPCYEEIWEIGKSDVDAADGNHRASVDIAKAHGQTFEYTRPCNDNIVN